MKLAAALALFALFGAPVGAHRLDEYLEATILSVDKDHLHASMRLVPGVAVSSIVLSAIDTDGDGVISQPEQRAYAAQVLRAVSLRIDGTHLAPRLASFEFPALDEIRQGLGEIRIDFDAALPRGNTYRKLVFENHETIRSAVYLVNCLMPRDPDIRIVAQNRNEQQSSYQLDYTVAMPASSSVLWFSGFGTLFQLGIRHIAEGTDHLLFLLALLLPAPLLFSRNRWTRSAGVRASLVRILTVVTAFTVGHSITLALAAMSVVHVPSRPVEVLIAVSILVSALHALRPLFPGRETVIAAFFGLIHGLAFATTLGQLGLERWQRVAGILGFNLGIETMQLLVVAAVMPSLILLSRSRAYSAVRIGGALFAAMASLGWIAERLFSKHTPVDLVVNSLAHHALWIAATLLVCATVSMMNVTWSRFRSV